ncbi:MAG: DUF2634 domain-containing protein [Gammaproteobacteria bacterium]|nr:DUF2634 domain-containing protein [Gammaproteobacteria bacterium]
MTTYTYTVNSPTTVGGTASGGAAGSLDAEIRRLFGTDIYFDNDYLITNKGDFQLLEGVANLRQAIYHRLITRPGEYKFVPDYGVGIATYVKRKRTNSNLDSMENAIRTNLLRDSRLSAISKIVVEYINGGVKIAISIAVAGKTLLFRPYEFTKETL